MSLDKVLWYGSIAPGCAGFRCFVVEFCMLDSLFMHGLAVYAGSEARGHVGLPKP